MDLHLPTLIRSRPVAVKRKELKPFCMFQNFASGILEEKEKELVCVPVPKRRPVPEAPIVVSKTLQNFNPMQHDIHSKIQFQQKLRLDFNLQERMEALKNHRTSKLDVKTAASIPASYKNSELKNCPKPEIPRAIGMQPTICSQDWQPVNRPKPYKPTAMATQPARNQNLKSESCLKTVVPSYITSKQTRESYHLEPEKTIQAIPENRSKSCLTVTVKSTLHGTQNFGPKDQRTSLASKLASKYSCLVKSWNWTPAPEVRSPDRFQKEGGDGEHSNSENEPIEDIFGVMSILDLDDECNGVKIPNSVPTSTDEIRTLKFRQAQLTPLSFLLEEKWVDLQPGNFQVKPSFATQLQMTDENAYFYIEPKSGTKSYDAEFFVVTAISPSGQMPFVHVLRDTVNKNRLRCSFYPEEPGTHIARVNLGVHGDHPIDGSPLSMTICRNYALYGSRTVSIKNLALDKPTMGRELNISDMFRIGGITTTEFANVIYATDTIGCQIWKFSVYQEQLLLTEKYDIFRCNVGGQWSCKPTAITYDKITQLLLVTDSANHQVCKFTLNGRFVASFGSEGIRPGEFKYPSGIAVSVKGVIAVVDMSNHRIQLFSGAGVLIHHRSIYDGRTKFTSTSSVTGIVFNPEGNRIYYSDTNCEVVYVLNLDLEFTMSHDHAAFGSSCTPVGLALDDIGNILVCDPGSNVVRVFNPNGVLIHTIFATGANPLEGPEHILVLSGGVCCVLDKDGTQLRIF